MLDLADFLEPVSVNQITEDTGITDGQFARHIAIFENEFPDLENIDVILVGIPELRGTGLPVINNVNNPDVIRKHLYQLHYWHTNVRIADIGNMKSGAQLADSYAGVKTVVSELLAAGKTVILIGGSHDLTLAQYQAHAQINQTVECTCIDAAIDLRSESMIRSENFLLEMLTGEPNLVKHYNHIGFQSYLVHPRMLETMDKLRFDCFRVGVVKDDIEEMEPVIRNSNMVSFDLSAIKNSDSPVSRLSPNGLCGMEACTLTRYAGMSGHAGTFGIYGYDASLDRYEMSAKQVSQMIWYFIDGKNKSLHESNLNDRHNFNEFHSVFGELDTTFLQSKRTGRWWMQLPDEKYIACSHKDYLAASRNEIPERWLRTQERL